MIPIAIPNKRTTHHTWILYTITALALFGTLGIEKCYGAMKLNSQGYLIMQTEESPKPQTQTAHEKHRAKEYEQIQQQIADLKKDNDSQMDNQDMHTPATTPVNQGNHTDSQQYNSQHLSTGSSPVDFNSQYQENHPPQYNSNGNYYDNSPPHSHQTEQSNSEASSTYDEQRHVHTLLKTNNVRTYNIWKAALPKNNAHNRTSHSDNPTNQPTLTNNNHDKATSNYLQANTTGRQMHTQAPYGSMPNQNTHTARHNMLPWDAIAQIATTRRDNSSVDGNNQYKQAQPPQYNNNGNYYDNSLPHHSHQTAQSGSAPSSTYDEQSHVHTPLKTNSDNQPQNNNIDSPPPSNENTEEIGRYGAWKKIVTTPATYTQPTPTPIIVTNTDNQHDTDEEDDDYERAMIDTHQTPISDNNDTPNNNRNNNNLVNNNIAAETTDNQDTPPKNTKPTPASMIWFSLVCIILYPICNYCGITKSITKQTSLIALNTFRKLPFFNS